MEKKVRIGPNQWYVIGKLFILIVFATAVFWVSYQRGMDSFLRWLCILVGVIFLWSNVYWADCSKNEICTTRLGILKRHIPAERISSVQLVAWRSRHQTHLFVVICLDGRILYDYDRVFLSWRLSPKVIAIPILKSEWREHSQNLAKLYGNVEHHPSFRYWRKGQNKKLKK